MRHPWPHLSKNEFIDIIAPSGTTDKNDIQVIHDYLIREGFKPRIPDTILGDHPICAHTDAIRFAHLKNALLAQDSTLIWCVRGGHGVSRIMPELTQLKKPTQQKLLVGFSDICSLHLWLNQHWQWPSLHGPMSRMAALGKLDPQDIEALHQLWFKGLQGYTLNHFQPLNSIAEQLHTVEGITAGGCLSVLQTSFGTSWQLDGRNKILFLEDINEQPYRIDRSLVHLANAGVFHHAKALILGDFGEQASEAKMMHAVIHDILKNYFPHHGIQLPVFRLKGFGHGERNQPVPFGVNAKITASTISFSARYM